MSLFSPGKCIIAVCLLLLTVPTDVRGEMSQSELQKQLSRIILQRNDIFARHGYIFKSSELNSYYRKKSWYRPDRAFTWSRLNRSEQKRVNGLIKKEKALVEKIVKKTKKWNRNWTKKYFKKVSPVSPYPSKLITEIKSFMKEKNIHEDHYILPQARCFSMMYEISPKEMKTLKAVSKKKGTSFSYHEATYDQKGKIRRLSQCWYSDMMGDNCMGARHFDSKGRVILITRPVPQTTLGSQWYFQYINNMLVWMVFDIKSHAGSDYHVAKKFYP